MDFLDSFHASLLNRKGETLVIEGKSGSGKTYRLKQLQAEAARRGNVFLYANEINGEMSQSYYLDSLIRGLMGENFTFYIHKELESKRGNSLISVPIAIDVRERIKDLDNSITRLLFQSKDSLEDKFIELITRISRYLNEDEYLLIFLDFIAPIIGREKRVALVKILGSLPKNTKVILSQEPGDILVNSPEFRLLKNVKMLPRLGSLDGNDVKLSLIETIPALKRDSEFHKEITQRFGTIPLNLKLILHLLSKSKDPYDTINKISGDTRSLFVETLKTLNADERWTALHLAFIQDFVGFKFLSVLLGKTEKEVENILKRESMEYLLEKKEYQGKELYRLSHPLFKEYLLEALKETSVSIASFHRHMAMCYLYYLKINPDDHEILKQITLELIASGDKKHFILAVDHTFKKKFLLGMFDICLEELSLALEYTQNTDISPHYIAVIYNNLGIVYGQMDNLEQALIMHRSALNIDKSLNDRVAVAQDLINIGITHFAMGDYPKSLIYHQAALKINQDLVILPNEARSLEAIGTIYSELGQYEKALKFLRRAMLIQNQIGDRSGLAAQLGNIGTIYSRLGDNPMALEYFQRSLQIFNQIGSALEVEVIEGQIQITQDNLNPDMQKKLLE
jgi:tetratricopeptide (TPR) repeat protein